LIAKIIKDLVFASSVFTYGAQSFVVIIVICTSNSVHHYHDLYMYQITPCVEHKNIDDWNSIHIIETEIPIDSLYTGEIAWIFQPWIILLYLNHYQVHSIIRTRLLNITIITKVYITFKCLHHNLGFEICNNLVSFLCHF
jgi:hypothetical protein